MFDGPGSAGWRRRNPSGLLRAARHVAAVCGFREPDNRLIVRQLARAVAAHRLFFAGLVAALIPAAVVTAFLVVAAVATLGPIPNRYIIGAPDTSDEWFAWVPLSLGTALAVGWPLLVPQPRRESIGLARAGRLLYPIAAPVALAAVFAAVIWGQPVGTKRLVLLAPFWTSVVLGLAVTPGLVVTLTLTELLRRRRDAVYPDAVAVGELCCALRLVLAPRRWGRLRDRQSALRHIGGAAAALEFGLPRRLATGDGARDAWMRERAAEVANALRELEPWVMTPGPGTRMDLASRLRDAIWCVAAGHWDLLPRSAPRRDRRSRAWRAIRAVAVALLPLGSVLFVHALVPRVLPDPVVGWLGGLCLGWAVVNLLLLLDPLLSRRIELFAAVLNALLPWRGGRRA